MWYCHHQLIVLSKRLIVSRGTCDIQFLTDDYFHVLEMICSVQRPTAACTCESVTAGDDGATTSVGSGHLSGDIDLCFSVLFYILSNRCLLQKDMAAGAVAVPTIVPLRPPVIGQHKTAVDTGTKIELHSGSYSSTYLHS